MNHENQLRPAHHRRGLAARQVIKLPGQLLPGDDENEAEKPAHRPPIKPTPSTTTIIRVRPTAKPIPTTPIIPPVRPTTPLIPPVIPTTRSLPPVPPIVPVPSIVTTASSKPVLTVLPPKPTTTPTSRSTSVSVPPVSNHRNVPTTTTSNTLPSSSETAPTSTGGVSTGALVGGIGGGIVGVGVLGLLVIFLVRIWRKRSSDRAAFNATTFRRSALLLDDPPVEKPTDSSPRPPTMIERRLAAPTLPPTSYGYEDQPQYGGDAYHHTAGYNGTQYSGSPYGSEQHYSGDQFGPTTGAYGQAAGYGTYGAPSTHTPHPQYPQQQPQHSPQQYSFSPGQILPSQQQRASPPSAGYTNLPNPFAPGPPVSAADVIAAARQAAESPAQPPRNVSPTQAQPNTYLSRQPTQAGGAPPAYLNEAKYADVQRDVKVAPLVVTNASSPHSPGASSQNPNANKRPASTYTVYDPEDAYGGI